STSACIPSAGSASFFCSSRRRHTRWPRDWSSDVCSSDLDAIVGASDYNSVLADFTIEDMLGLGIGPSCDLLDVNQLRGNGSFVRSEERRVGKECRARGRW